MPTSLTTPQTDFDMEGMKIRFGGGNDIDANTFINSHLHFTNVVQEVHNGLSAELNSDKKISIKINANAPGSFLVDLSVVASGIGGAIANIFSKDVINYSANVVQIVGGVYNYAKHLKGQKPKSIEKVGNSIKTTDHNGNVTIMDFTNANLAGANFYFSNPIIPAAIQKEFATLDSDSNVTSFGILDSKDNTIAEIEKEEFSDIAEMQIEEIVLADDKKVITVPATLQIKEQDWAFTKAWGFYMNGHKITAKIKDDKFIQRVLGREDAFFAGDSLEVMLDITQHLDKPTNVWVNKSYSIKEIRNHIKGSQQKSLF